MDDYQPPPLVYNASQISQFLNHIALPPRFHNQKPSLTLLRALHTHFISTFPYENLAIHYNPSHSISLDPQVLFEKAVTRNVGRGGYCMENALLFYHVLRGMGFDVYTVGARTRERDAGGVPGGEFPGWVHIINIVTLPPSTPSQTPQRYHVDIAFGGDGALHPLPLITSEEQRGEQRRGTRLHRGSQQLTKAEGEEIEDEGEGEGESAEDDPGDFYIYGKRMLLAGTVKENLGGRTKVVEVCETEEQRVKALEKWFGITLTKEEREGIRGFRSELGK